MVEEEAYSTKKKKFNIDETGPSSTALSLLL
jgi:hypothetical protein